MAPAAETSKFRDGADTPTLNEVLQENVRLKNSLEALERENSILKEQLTETQASLGQLYMASKRQEEPKHVEKLSRRPQPPPFLTRARSPSSDEIVEIPEPPRKKQKQRETFTATLATTQEQIHPQVETNNPIRNPDSAPSSSRAEGSSRPRPVSPGLEPTSGKVKPIGQLPKISTPLPPKVSIKLSPSERKRTEKINDGPRIAKTKGSTERKGECSSDDAASSATSSTSSVVMLKASPKEDKPKPRIKVKAKDVFILPDDTVQLYLKSAPALKITPRPLDIQVPWKFLRLAYGGSDQQFLQFIQEDMNPSGPVQRRLVFPVLDLNPAMPSQPGEPGLVFASRHELLSNPPWTLFCKLSSTTPAVWHYLGEYTNVLCGKMTAGQFKSQTLVVRKEWAKLVLKKKAFDVYVSMRARIALRKTGAIPLDDKKVEDDLINAEMTAIKHKKGIPLTEEDIISAFSSGDEGIDIIRMTCVKYDHVFANDMKAKFANYDNLIAADDRKKEEQGKGNDRATKTTTAPKRQAKKAKAQSQIQSDSSEAEDESQSDVAMPRDSDKEFVASPRNIAGPSRRPRRTIRTKPVLADDAEV